MKQTIKIDDGVRQKVDAFCFCTGNTANDMFNILIQLGMKNYPIDMEAVRKRKTEEIKEALKSLEEIQAKIIKDIAEGSAWLKPKAVAVAGVDR